MAGRPSDPGRHDRQGTDDLNGTIHQPARLRIVAALAALGPGESVNFTHLRRELGFTDGNLGAHLLTLEKAGYLTITRTHRGLRPTTFVALSPSGREAFKEYRAALLALLGR